MILRLTQNLNARLKGGPMAESELHEDPLLDWSARTFEAGAAEHLLLCNTKTLYCVVVGEITVTDVDHFTERALDAVRAILDGAGLGKVGRGVGPVQFAKSLDRSVTGSMNELVAHATVLLADQNMSMQKVGLRLNDVLLSVLRRGGQKYGRPREAFAELVAGAGG
jgi:hypothetical protein